MPTGLPPAARDLDQATLIELLDNAGPVPLPAAQAIALLQRLNETDAAVFGALAYRALTGVEPDAAPRPAADLVPGFPPFVSEVLQRAVSGPDERRPSPAALLIVLEMAPTDTWPVLAPVEALDQEPAPQPEPVSELIRPEVEVESDEAEPVDADPSPEPAPAP
ncbi:MAG: hypothetical protein L0H31_10705, partial [Nocardioidaceae bacterium]|nr:hypothetical protein [Nocardioidaceae bacterium]